MCGPRLPDQGDSRAVQLSARPLIKSGTGGGVSPTQHQPTHHSRTRPARIDGWHDAFVNRRRAQGARCCKMRCAHGMPGAMCSAHSGPAALRQRERPCRSDNDEVDDNEDDGLLLAGDVDEFADHSCPPPAMDEHGRSYTEVAASASALLANLHIGDSLMTFRFEFFLEGFRAG